MKDWDKDHVDLEWRAPRDNGAPIKAYIIQKRPKGQLGWEEGTRVPGSEIKCTVPGLTEGQEYEFRVIAVNKAGPGEPSDPSDMVLCKPRKCRSYFFFVVCVYNH